MATCDDEQLLLEQNSADSEDEDVEMLDVDRNDGAEGGDAADDFDPFPPLAPPGPDVDDQNGTCFQKAGRAVRDCMIGCCHDCKAMDKVIFVFHLFLMFVGFAIATVSTISKMTTHNQCYLKALYNPDGSMNYSQELYWCDSLLYDALVTMSLAFLFIMVNWTAQLNKNTWWMWIKLVLHVVGWVLQLGGGVLLLVAFFSWCASIEAAMEQDRPSFKPNDTNRCLVAAEYFDDEKNGETTLTTLYSLTLASLSLALLAGLMWTVTLGLCLAHFCEFLHRRKDEHEADDDDDDQTADEEEEPGDENEYRYPPFDENLVRQRRIAGGYNLNVHEDELGDGAAATGDNRDVGA